MRVIQFQERFLLSIVYWQIWNRIVVFRVLLRLGAISTHYFLLSASNPNVPPEGPDGLALFFFVVLVDVAKSDHETPVAGLEEAAAFC